MLNDLFTPHIHYSIRRNSSLKYPKSPLRYPGGKARAVDQILRIIPATESVLVSPFFGGGSVEIAAASLGLTVRGYDVFQPLVDFWIELLLNPQRLANQVETFFPLEKKRFYDLQKGSFSNRLDSAAVFYVLNRSSFGGSTLSGGMSPGHPRFTKSSIEYLRNFSVPRLNVAFGDFHETIPDHPNDFLYLDPPYLIANTLYGKNGDTHKYFDHVGLCDILRKRDKWVLSYNDCDEIRKMYHGFRTFSPHWKYGMSHEKESRELLILSDDLPELITQHRPLQIGLFD